MIRFNHLINSWEYCDDYHSPVWKSISAGWARWLAGQGYEVTTLAVA